MASGMDMMVSSLMKGMGLDPEEIKNKVSEFGKLLVEFKQQMDRIETQNAEILTILKGANNGTQAETDRSNGSQARIEYGA